MNAMHEGSYQVGKEPCPKCREKGEDTSGDNLVKYSDGHGYCFACNHYLRADGTAPVESTLKEAPKDWKPIAGKIEALTHRNLREATARLFGYRVATKQSTGEKVEVASYYKDGELVAQHLRFPDKQFRWIGDAKKVPLWGQHLWKMNGRRLIITEGEIDCMSVAQAQDLKWPVVSLPGGAAGAVRAVRDNYDFVASYQEIVLCFDNDDAGRKAAKLVAELLPPGRVKIVTTPRKDANEHVKANDVKALMTALWEAQSYRPDGIIHVSEVVSSHKGGLEVWEFPFDSMTEFLIGQRPGEMTMWTSGTGSGKSTIIRELVNHHLMSDRPVGMIMLEEDPSETVDDIVSLRLGKPVRKIMATRKLNELRAKMGRKPLNQDIMDNLTDEEYANARAGMNNTGLYIYDHYGSSDFDNLINRVEYMAVSLGVKTVVLDHVTAAVAGMMQDGDNGERLLIDKFMKDLRSLVERTGIHLDLVSQLRKSNGQGWEEGEQITLQALRGSGSLGSVPNTIIAMERNRQHPDPSVANTSIMRILKNRFTGRAGVAAALRYDGDTGRLIDVPFHLQPDGTVTFGDQEVEADKPAVFDDESDD
jgi:twinkle protein